MLVRALCFLTVAFRRRLDAQAPEQLRGRGSGIAAVSEDRMQPLVSLVMDHEVDDTPRVECLGTRFSMLVHRAPPKRGIKKRQVRIGGLNMRHTRETPRLLC